MVDSVLYIHVPFCRQTSLYDDAASHVVHSGAERDAYSAYLEAAERELQIYHTAYVKERRAKNGPQMTAIFIGGEGADLLPAAFIHRLIRKAKKIWSITSPIEITLEMNPFYCLNPSRYIAQLKRAGVTRVSVRTFSFSPFVAAFLGEGYSPYRTKTTLYAARRNGMDVSIDLMYGLPGQTKAEWEKTLHKAISYHVTHISCYAFFAEAGTPLASSSFSSCIGRSSADKEAEEYERAEKILSRVGFSWYEMFSWTRKGRQSVYLRACYRGDDCYTVGPGACGRRGNTRLYTFKDFTSWRHAVRQKKSLVEKMDVLTEEEQREEALLLAFSFRNGWNEGNLFKKGLKIPTSLRDLLLRKGFLMREIDGKVSPSLRGRLIATSLTKEILALLSQESSNIAV